MHGQTDVMTEDITYSALRVPRSATSLANQGLRCGD
jgi:hypothetical protein